MPGFDRAKTLQTAEKYVKAGKLNEAVSEYKKLADDNPRDMNAINKLGDILVRAGRVPEALKHFLRIADFYAQEGFFLKAIAMYKKICKADPANIECQKRLGVMYQQQGLATEAKAQFVQVAEHLIRQTQIPEAAELLNKVLEIEPANLKVRLTLAEMLARASKGEDAAREFCEVARMTAARGAVEETVQVIRKAVKAAPAKPELASILLSVVAKVEAVPGDVVGAAQEIARQMAKSSLAAVLHAEAMRRAGRQAEAETAFQRVAEATDLEDDLSAEALILLGRFHAGRGGDADDWQMIERVISRLTSEGRAPDAASLLDDYLKKQPSHKQALAGRAEIAAAAGDSEVEGRMLSRLAPILIAARDLDRAGEVVNRLVSLRPSDTEALALREQLANPAASSPTGGHASMDDAPRLPDDDGAGTDTVTESAAPIVVDSAEESASAEEIFSLDEDTLVVEDESGEAEQASGPTMAEEPEEDEAAYGPRSRIQEIQAAESGDEPIDEDFISEHLTEADVFVKYGLPEKAREQIKAVLDRYPQHEASRLRLKDILIGEGNTEGAIRECMALAGLKRSQGREAEARELVNEALRIDPESPQLSDVSISAVPGDTSQPAVGKARRSAGGSTGSRAKASAPPEIAEQSPTGARAASEETIDIDDDLEIDIDLPETETPLGIQTSDESDDGGSVGSKPPVEDTSQAVGVTTMRTARPVVHERIEEESPEDLTASAASPSIAGGAGAAPEAPLPPPAADLATEEEIELVPAVRPARPAGEPDEEKIGEVDFYIEQGLLEEARQVLFQLGKQYPASTAVKERLARLDDSGKPPARPAAVAPAAPAHQDPADVDFEVEQALAGKAPRGTAPAVTPRAEAPRPVFRVEKPTVDSGGEFFDLAAELESSLADEQARDNAQVKEALDGQAHSFEDIFAAFKKGVAQQVDNDDFETHYNLGIAYKEMGLVDEAIGELQFAARDPARTLECCGILGLCFRDKGMHDLALKWYRRGLDHPGLDERQTLGLRYDIAEVFREQGAYDQALRAYTEVYGIDSTYRDVTARIKEVKGLLASSGR